MKNSYLTGLKAMVFSATVILSSLPTAQARTLPAATCVRDVTEVMEAQGPYFDEGGEQYPNFVGKRICGDLDRYLFDAKADEERFRICVRTAGETENTPDRGTIPGRPNAVIGYDWGIIYECAIAVGKSDKSAQRVAFDITIAAWKDAKSYKKHKKPRCD